jgi:hypothetical protein
MSVGDDEVGWIRMLSWRAALYLHRNHAGLGPGVIGFIPSKAFLNSFSEQYP